MKKERKINKYFKGEKTVDGAGVRLVRIFGFGETSSVDPFLMLDFFDSKNSEDYVNGFPWHPHRGIETVTYLLDGAIKHEDSLGNSGIIQDGECQWMTAGSGIIHQEMPQISTRLRGLQLWVNLPSKNKMADPKYNSIDKDSIPVVDDSNSSIKVIAGKYGDIVGAFDPDFVKINYLDVELGSNRIWEYESNEKYNQIIYIIEGQGEIGETTIEENVCVVLDDGQITKVKSGNNKMRFILFEGERLKESIAWGGPIVMNTKEELDTAFKELKNGTFIK